MQQNFFQKFTSIYTDKSINGWVRGLAWVGTAAVIYVIGDSIYKIVFPSQDAKNAANIANHINDSITQEKANGLTPSYPAPNYDTLANTIYNSGNTFGHLGDSFSVINDTLKKMNNDLDVSMLIKSFSSRNNKDLITFVNESFAAHWLGVFNPDKSSVNDDWKAKGITYRL
jgi:hypothetical protein